MGRAPWWVVMSLGGACVVVGAWLLAEPFRSLTVLHWLIVAGLLVGGAGELAGAPAMPRPWLTRFIGLGWIAVGVVAAVWPGITILTLALLVGVALVAGGVLEVVTALVDRGGDRLLLALSGATNVVVGVLAVSWPAITVLVLAVVFGFRTVLLGVAQIASAFHLRADPDGSTTGEASRVRPRWWRLTGSAVALALALGAMAISVAIHRRAPDDPGAFYDVPSPLPDGPPGTIIRSELVEGFHAGATTYRVLYTSTGHDGSPTAVSGLVVIPAGVPPSEGRKVVAFTHGTVGVATNCSPSAVGAAALAAYEGLDDFIAAGDVVAATDYEGLGTPGPHPYLVGAAEAMNALDSVRAAHNLAAAHAGTEFAVWGHSQGGHASLFTGQLAAAYAPELHLVGVAAGAPPTDLVDLFAVNIETTIGKVLLSMAVTSWAGVYDDAGLDQIVTPDARPAVEKIAERCLYDPTQILASVPASLLLGLTFLSAPPWDVEPWSTIIAENTPGNAPTGVPMLVTQGEIDPIMPVEVTTRFVAALCAGGETVEYRVLPGVGHVEAGHVAAPGVAEWIAARFAGEPASDTCASR